MTDQEPRTAAEWAEQISRSPATDEEIVARIQRQTRMQTLAEVKAAIERELMSSSTFAALRVVGGMIEREGA